MSQLRPSLDSVRTIMLLLPLLATLGHCGNTHSLGQVLFVQPSEPSSGLLKMFDEDQMFFYNFTDHSTMPWLKDFDKWRDLAFPNAENISSHVELYQHLREDLTKVLENLTPEARGGVHATVFAAHPLRLGVQNTLICVISDVFPPALTITWRKDAEIVTRGLNTYKYFALGDLSFQAFSYLNVTPYHSDVFSCEVQVAGDNRTIIEYWIPQYPIPSDLLENVLCGLGFTLGIIFLIAGLLFFYFAVRLHNRD